MKLQNNIANINDHTVEYIKTSMQLAQKNEINKKYTVSTIFGQSTVQGKVYKLLSCKTS